MILGILGLVLLILAAPHTLEAQQAEKVSRIGVLWPSGAPPVSPRMESFREGLRESGYVEGQNVAIELRFAESRERLHELIGELARLNVNVIATFGDLGMQIARQAGTSIPIVVLADDVSAEALDGSLARPARNLTGVSILAPELSAKRLEVLKQLLPRVSRVAALSDAAGESQMKATAEAARLLGVKLQRIDVRGRDDLGRAFETAKRQRAEAIHVLSSPLLASLYRDIIALAAENRLPVIYQWREHAEAGGLVAYGPSLGAVWKQTALMIARVLRGTRPADIPIQQPTKFDLVVNLKTARALRLTIPPSALIRADELIQ